jgi:hypothetical protein
MTGCDYLDNVKGVGFITILGIFSEPNSLSAIRKVIQRKGLTSSETDQYLSKVESLINVFKYQYVYDPDRKRLTHLNEPKTTAEKKALTDDPNIGHFIGHPFDNLTKFAEGQLNFKTLKPRPESKTNFDKILRFFSYKPNPELGFLSNLCQRTITYDNFETVMEPKAAAKPPTPKKTPVKEKSETASRFDTKSRLQDIHSISTKMSPRKLPSMRKTLIKMRKNYHRKFLKSRRLRKISIDSHY